MSPVMDNFVHSLVEMAKAMEELPQVQNALEKSTQTIEQQGHMIASREESILRLKADIETLQAKVRDAEASRDDAELRFLDLDEKAGKVLRTLGTFQSEAQSLAELLSPKPEPVPEPTPEPRPTPDMGYGDPSGDWQQPPTQPAAEDHSGPLSVPIPGRPYDYIDARGRGQYYNRNEIGQFAPVQREPDPTPATVPVASEQPTAIPTEPIASTPIEAPQSGQSEPGPTAYSTEAQSPSALAGTPQAPIASETTASPPNAAQPVDDVGYHNEPANYSTDWYKWADRMDKRYGFSKWPQRVATAAQ